MLSPSEDSKDKDAEIHRLKKLVHELKASRTPRTPRTPRESTTPRGTADGLVSPKSPQPIPDFTVTEPKASPQTNGVHKSPSNQAIPATSPSATLSPTPPSEAPANKSPRTPSIVIPTSNGAPLSARVSGATSPVSLPYTPFTPTPGATSSPVQFPSRPPPQPPTGTSPPARPTPTKATPSPAKGAGRPLTPPATPPRTPSPPVSAKNGPLNKVPSLSLGDITSKAAASPTPAATTSTSTTPKSTATTPKSSSVTSPTTPVTPTSKPTKSPRGKSPRDATGTFEI